MSPFKHVGMVAQITRPGLRNRESELKIWFFQVKDGFADICEWPTFSRGRWKARKKKRRLEHGNGEARAFCAALPRPARVGMEARICSRVSISSSASSGNCFRMRIARGHPGSEEMSYFAVCRVIRFW